MKTKIYYNIPVIIAKTNKKYFGNRKYAMLQISSDFADNDEEKELASCIRVRLYGTTKNSFELIMEKSGTTCTLLKAVKLYSNYIEQIHKYLYTSKDGETTILKGATIINFKEFFKLEGFEIVRQGFKGTSRGLKGFEITNKEFEESCKELEGYK